MRAVRFDIESKSIKQGWHAIPVLCYVDFHRRGSRLIANSACEGR